MVTVRVVVWFSQFCSQGQPHVALHLPSVFAACIDFWLFIFHLNAGICYRKLAADSLVVFPHQHLSQWQKKKHHGGTTNAVLWSCWRGNPRSGTRRVYGMDEHFLWHQQSWSVLGGTIIQQSADSDWISWSLDLWRLRNSQLH